MLGEKIKELRLKANLTQGALAKKANVSVAEVCRIETGERKNPSMSLLVNLLKALEVTEEEFLVITGFKAA